MHFHFAADRILDLPTLSRTLSKHFVDLGPFSTKWTDKVAKRRVIGQALTQLLAVGQHRGDSETTAGR